MKRREDWDVKLAGWIKANALRPFSWVEGFDCCLMGADVIRAMTDVDLGSEIRGTYNDPVSAAAAMYRVFGARDLPELLETLAHLHGWEEIPSNRYAQRGDIALIRSDGNAFGGAVGVVAGTLTIAFRDEQLRAFSTIENAGEELPIMRVWRIPVV